MYSFFKGKIRITNLFYKIVDINEMLITDELLRFLVLHHMLHKWKNAWKMKEKLIKPTNPSHLYPIPVLSKMLSQQCNQNIMINVILKSYKY